MFVTGTVQHEGMLFDVRLNVEKTTKGWRQRVIEFANPDEQRVDIRITDYLNVDYMRKEKLSVLKSWWRHDLTKFSLEFEEPVLKSDLLYTQDC
jgi:hypothetical protein